MTSDKYLAGHLLVAIPALGDPNFFRSVVIMLQHGAEGASGLVLTRPSTTPVSEMWKSATGGYCDCDRPVRIGGPVRGPVIALHQNPFLADDQVLDDVWVSSSVENLKRLLEEPSDQLQIFSGYSGWGPGQLESEIAAGGWLTCPAKTTDIFVDSEELWRDACDRIGQDILGLHFGNRQPSDPGLN